MGRHKDDDDDGSNDRSYDDDDRRRHDEKRRSRRNDDAQQFLKQEKSDKKHQDEKQKGQGRRDEDDDNNNNEDKVVVDRRHSSDRQGEQDRRKRSRSSKKGSIDDGRRGRSRSRHGKRDDDDKKKKKKSSKKRHKKRKRRSYSSSSSSSSSSSASDDDSSDSDDRKKGEKSASTVTKTTAAAAAAVTNERLLAKLAARGETLEERKRRRAEKSSQKRAAYISTKFGYTAEENPFHDPNLSEAFTWNKKKDQQPAVSKKEPVNQQEQQHDSQTMKKKEKGSELKTLEEIEKLRQRRKDRELQQEEMERIRREESRMKELENFDEWAKKEEHFHVQQQRQRSAIRLVDGREKPIDILAKNVLLFGLSEQEKKNRGASVKYQEKYNVLEELENLEAELEEPQDFLKMLKLNELKQVLVDIDAFLTLERDAQSDNNNNNNSDADEASGTILKYWQALRVVCVDEILFLETGGKEGSHSKMVQEIQKIFHQDGQSDDAQLEQMRRDVAEKLRASNNNNNNNINNNNNQEDGTTALQDQKYWKDVQEQLEVHLAKRELSMLHSRMLVGQLERLEQKREQLSQAAALKGSNDDDDQKLPAAAAAGMAQEAGRGGQAEEYEPQQPKLPDNVAQGFGDLEEELGLTDEIVSAQQQPAYAWADRYRPRKPRYFNRVKTGYDWNKYNKTHYDKDTPPPKTVQGYKFNIFYPDLIDPSAGTPQFKLEPADSDEFCIIRFHAGPPYEDVAFKIINREWNRSRKHGFKCTFERGVLSLYFNFKNFWYRR